MSIPAHPRRMVAREYRPLVDKALEAGWTLTISGRGHPKLTNPDGTYSTPVPATSGGRHKGLPKAIRLRLRAHGVDV
jgi:hypothetical protein